MKPSDQRTLLIVILCFVSKVATYLCHPSASMCYLVCLYVLPCLPLCATLSASMCYPCLPLCATLSASVCFLGLFCVCAACLHRALPFLHIRLLSALPASACYLVYTFACFHLYLSMFPCLPIWATLPVTACTYVCSACYVFVCSRLLLHAPLLLCMLLYLPLHARHLDMSASVCSIACLCALPCVPMHAPLCATTYSNVCSACFLACPSFFPYLPLRASLLAFVCALLCLCVCPHLPLCVPSSASVSVLAYLTGYALVCLCGVCSHLSLCVPSSASVCALVCLYVCSHLSLCVS